MRQDRGRADRPHRPGPAADELLGRNPLVLLLGMLFDQHVRQRGSGTLAEGTATSPASK
jgi:hypothetical protein